MKWIVLFIVSCIGLNLSAAPEGFDKYELIIKRNIFDSTRRKKVPYVPKKPRPPVVVEKEDPPEPEPQRDVVILTGIIADDNKATAMFYSMNRDFSGNVNLNEEFAGMKVVTITSEYVCLETKDKQLKLPVGSKLVRVDEGPWSVNEVTGDDRDMVAMRSKRDKSSSDKKSGSSKSSGGSAEDILKKMLERRNQELNK